MTASTALEIEPERRNASGHVEAELVAHELAHARLPTRAWRAAAPAPRRCARRPDSIVEELVVHAHSSRGRITGTRSRLSDRDRKTRSSPRHLADVDPRLLRCWRSCRPLRRSGPCLLRRLATAGTSRPSSSLLVDSLLRVLDLMMLLDERRPHGVIADGPLFLVFSSTVQVTNQSARWCIAGAYCDAAGGDPARQAEGRRRSIPRTVVESPYRGRAAAGAAWSPTRWRRRSERSGRRPRGSCGLARQHRLAGDRRGRCRLSARARGSEARLTVSVFGPKPRTRRTPGRRRGAARARRGR